ncbi:hypothetical protein HBB16_16940 [Pseudonocardia sp. MCCB 268]|nr:hypothetical protein [Pseudonocardia cytotoxica]
MPFVLLYVVLEGGGDRRAGRVDRTGWTLLVLLAGSVLGLLLARSEGPAPPARSPPRCSAAGSRTRRRPTTC